MSESLEKENKEKEENKENEKEKDTKIETAEADQKKEEKAETAENKKKESEKKEAESHSADDETSRHLAEAEAELKRSELLGNKLPSFLNTRSHAPCAILFSRVSGSYRCFLHRGYASMKRYTHAVDKCELSPLSQRLHWFMVIVGTSL